MFESYLNRAVLFVTLFVGFGLTIFEPPCALAQATAPPSAASPPETTGESVPAKVGPIFEAAFLSNTRQLTFEGRRAGEGYFSADGQRMVFQSEREPGNPFFQIYVMDLENGDIERVSPGTGKTTCAWLHPTSNRVLFASTHDDPQAKQKQDDELKMRAEGTQRRYSWDYDATYEVYEHDMDSGQTRKLTSAKGYDAEGSWSPDGKWIAFASNRSAYERQLTAEEAATLERDPAFFNEIYLMRSDGSEVRRLTNSNGYDGGPFFSPDGQRICWRRFTEDGARAEIMTMKTDGTDQRQLTTLGAMSWAPYYHPSGQYLIFTTNIHGFSNFELYLVAADGQTPPIRVTDTEGFDGLPVFTPDGQRLAWTSNRTAAKQSQIFLADWNHDEALNRLGLTAAPSATAAQVAAGAVDAPPLSDNEIESEADRSLSASSAEFRPQDLLRHVDFLCRKELGGRLTGTAGELQATAYVAAFLDSLGLEPAGDDGGWFQPFEFTSGVSLGTSNRLTFGGSDLQLNQQWRPTTVSANGDFPAAGVVFAGYGIAAPKTEEQEEYDSFVHLDVKDQWVLTFRFLPEDVPSERRQHLARHSSLRYKAMKIRDLGAKGLIVVSGPTSQVKQQLVPLKYDGAISGSSIPVLSITDDVAKQWLQAAGKNLGTLQAELDKGEPAMGFGIPNLQVAAAVELTQVKKSGRNVLGRLPAKAGQVAEQAVIIGAHVDHLGRGTGGSLARDEEANQIHVGADDNASGVAAVLEVAQYLADQQKRGKLRLNRDIIFAAWSGEELGLIGSNHYAQSLYDSISQSASTAGGHGHAHGAHGAQGAQGAQGKGQPGNHGHGEQSAHGGDSDDPSIYPQIAACLNLDMVGRLEKRLVLQGVGSSSIWKSEIERRNAPVGLPITLQNDCFLPTDATSFFLKGVPILSAFTGSHSEYHTPRDTPDRLNYDDAARIARLIGLIGRSLGMRDEAPDFVRQERPEQDRPRAGLRAYLGTIPDYAQTDVKGVKLSGVGKNGPAEKAGVKGGDVIVELAGKKIENIYDYTYAIDAVKIGEETSIVVQRDGKRIPLKITPGSRD